MSMTAELNYRRNSGSVLQPVDSPGSATLEPANVGAPVERAIGFKFAKAEGTAQTGNTPAHAEIHLTNDGSC
jgi:hypothetical protein